MAKLLWTRRHHWAHAWPYGTLQKKLKADPNNTDYLFQLGEVYRKTGDLEQARDVYQRLLDIEPTHALDSAYLSY